MTADTENLVLSILREIRKEQADQRTLLLASVDHMRKMEHRLDARIIGLETRMIGVSDDLELMLKSELLGRFTHLETTIEQRLDALSDRIATVEGAPRP